MMLIRAATRRHGQAHLKRLVESVPIITNAILASGGGVVAAWPVKPMLRIIRLAATTPPILELLGYVPELVESDELEASIVRMRHGQLLTSLVNDQVSLKLLFPSAATVDAHLLTICIAVNEIRLIPNLK
jgi:predicted regulator of Ras-like GTPase activity (Roadblock/LC7/MglB family)